MNFRCSFNRHQNPTSGRVWESATVDCVETGPLDQAEASACSAVVYLMVWIANGVGLLLNYEFCIMNS